MTISVSSAFWDRLQGDAIELVDLIDLETPNGSFHWAVANLPVSATYSGALIEYTPFPGNVSMGAENANLAVSNGDFLVANSSSTFDALLQGQEITKSRVALSRVWVDTPDLDRWWVFQGTLGSFQWNRSEITGEVRDQMLWLKRRFPDKSYQDKCSWRFGSVGCGVDVTSFTVSIPAAQIDASSSTTLTVYVTSFTGGPYADGYFELGQLTWTAGVNSGSRRSIRVHTGDLLRMSHPLGTTIGVTDTFSLQAGCRRRRLADCNSKFNNVDRFLGYKEIPQQEEAY